MKSPTIQIKDCYRDKLCYYSSVKIVLLDAETEREFGYKANDLPPTSHKPVVFKCNDCGSLAKKNRREIKGTCRPCTVNIANKKRKETTNVKYGVDHVAQHPDTKKKTANTCQKLYGAKAPSKK
jgi:hypothetical protein